MLLAIDTATSTVTAAVVHDGAVLAESSTVDHRRHGELLAPAVQRVLAGAGVTAADLDVVAVGVGPGPFTGLRVGLVTARVLAHARGIPVHGACSLDVLAHQALEAGVVAGEFLVATDARRQEVFWSRYATDGGEDLQPVRGPEVARAADLPVDARVLPCVGRGPELYPEALHGVGGPLDVSAGSLGRLVERELASPQGSWLRRPEPLYLRRPDAAVPGPAKRVAPEGPR